MCTLVLLHRPDAAWPLLLAANRDEMLARPWEKPAFHWPAQPDVLGGRDTLAGGTWLAVNHAGVVAGVLNRTGSLGPEAGKRSRGELPLLALRHTNARDAAAAIAALDGTAWRSFNLVIADPSAAFFLRGLAAGPVQMAALPPDLCMVANTEPNDLQHKRIARHLPRFAAARPPEPPDWGDWPALLADADGPWEAALNVPDINGFGTASSALIGVAPGRLDFRFAAGAPGRAALEEVRPGGSAPWTPVGVPPLS
jgi:Transport and Golgi organisation 2